MSGTQSTPTPEPVDNPAGGSPATTGGGAPAQSRWTTGRILSVVSGCVVALISMALIFAGGALLIADRSLREEGYLTSDSEQLSSDGYAIVSDPIDLNIEGTDWPVLRRSLGDVRLRATPYSADSPLFLGVGPADEVSRYLQGVEHTTVQDLGGNARTSAHAGSAPAAAPTEQDFWATQTGGRGPQHLTWSSTSGRWRLVAMNADGSRDLTLLVDVGATVPALLWVVAALVLLGVLLLIPAILLIAIPLRRTALAATTLR